MKLTEIKLKRGRPVGVKNTTKTMTVTITKENYQNLLTVQAYLSEQHGFPVTLEQTVINVLKSALEK
jgi:hypothetical protein